MKIKRELPRHYFASLVILLLFEKALYAKDMIATSLGETCVLKNKEVTCFGEVVNNNIIQIPKLESPTYINLNSYYACAIDGKIKCWGYDSYSVIEPPNKDIVNPIQVGLGNKHGCAMTPEDVVCWGLRKGERTNVPNVVNPKKLAVGSDYSCVLDQEGVKCWGEPSSVLRPPALLNPIDLDVAHNNACAIDDAGVRCWGFGYKDNGDPWHPAYTIPPLVNPMSISVGNEYICATHNGGKVACWGNFLDKGLPDFAKDLKNVTEISSKGKWHLCYSTANEMDCKGFNNYGQIGGVLKNQNELKKLTIKTHKNEFCTLYPKSEYKSQLTCYGDVFDTNLFNINLNDKVVDFAVGGYWRIEYMCALTHAEDSLTTQIKCFGEHDLIKLAPTDLKDPYKIAAGRGWYCSADRSGIRCWGMTDEDDFETRFAKQFPTSGEVTKLVAGDDYYCALIDGRLNCEDILQNKALIVPHQLTNGVEDILADNRHLCARQNGDYLCWQVDKSGNPYELISLGPLRDVKMTLLDGVCGTKTDHSIKCYGVREVPKINMSDVEAIISYDPLTYIDKQGQLIDNYITFNFIKK